MCLRVSRSLSQCVCVRSPLDLNPILFILGRIGTETAPFLDAIITQAAQGLRREMLPYIKVLLINIDRSAQLQGILVPISASHAVLLM